MSSWPRVPLGDLVVEERPQRGDSDEPVWNLNLDQVEPDTGRVLERVRVPQDDLGPSTYPFAAGTVLYSKLRPYLNKVVVADEPGFATTELVPLRCKPQRAVPDYIAYFLRSAEFLSFANTVVAGAKMPRMVMSEFWKYQVPLPPLDEQRRIACILDKADALRTKRREALAQLDLLAQSIFLEMFGDPKFNPKSWQVKAIESVALDMRGGAALEPEDFVAEGFPVLHKGAIKPAGQIETDPKKKAFAKLSYAKGRPQNIVDRNYVAVTLRDLVPTGPSIGLAANLEHAPQDQYLLAQGAYGVRLDHAQMLPEYFVQLSNMPNFRNVLRQHAVGSTQIHIRNPVYLSIRIPVPPVELQVGFAARMRNLRHIGRCAEDSLGSSEMLFASLQTRAYRGEL